jgi:hypothetical protein
MQSKRDISRMREKITCTTLVSCGRVLMFYDAHCRASTAADAYDAAEGQIGAHSGPGSALDAALAAGRQPNTAENANPVWTGTPTDGGGQPLSAVHPRHHRPGARPCP